MIVPYESTGPYEKPFVHYCFVDEPVTIVQVNPMHTKRVKEINDDSPLKTDEKDPGNHADIVRLGHALSVVVPEGDAAYLRRLNNVEKTVSQGTDSPPQSTPATRFHHIPLIRNW